MMSRSHLVFVAGFGVIALTAVFLSRIQSMQKVAPPGVRLLARGAQGEGGKIIGTNTVDLPERVLRFESQEIPMPDVVSDWLPKDTTLAQRLYTETNGFWVQVNAVVMGKDRTSIHKPEYCLQGQGFETEKNELTEVAVARPHPYSLPVMKMTLSKDAQRPDGTRVKQRALFVYWYVADKQITADHGTMIKWMSRDLIFHWTLNRWAYVSCFAVCPPGQEDALFARMHDFIAAAVPQFQLAAGPFATPPKQP